MSKTPQTEDAEPIRHDVPTKDLGANSISTQENLGRSHRPVWRLKGDPIPDIQMERGSGFVKPDKEAATCTTRERASKLVKCMRGRGIADLESIGE